MFLVWPFLTAEAGARGPRRGRQARAPHRLPVVGIRDDVEQQTNPITQFHAGVERLIERSRLEWTFLRPSGFAANTLAWAPQIRADGVVRWVYGTAARSLIHERDIAAVAVRALTGDGHGGAKYVLTGPQPLTQAEQVRPIGEAISRPLRWEEISREAAREQMLTYWPPALVDGALDHQSVDPESQNRYHEHETTGA
ncbi:MAG: hypothetical protein ACRDYA_19225 [Egibacteraceae bacterium]